MSSPDSPTRRRPVPPPKTESQARLREDLTSPGRQQRNASIQHESSSNVQTNTLHTDTLHTEAQKREAMNHLTLPTGWDMRNEVDVTYHTHVAKPVVHETIHQQTTELVEPRITRDIHRYHQYDHIQPLEVEIPNESYATNAKGEVIHAPGGLNTKEAGQSSHWEQGRQDRGYGLSHTLADQKDQDEVNSEAERGKTAGPYPLRAEGGGERVLHGIRDGGIARRFGGTLTSPTHSTNHANHNHAPEEPQTRPRGGGPPTPRRDSFHSAEEHAYAPIPPPHPTSDPDLTSTMDQHFNRLSLQDQVAKPLPPLPDTSPRSPTHSKGSVRRMSGDNKLRDRFSMDSSRKSVDDQNPNPRLDEESVPDRGSSIRKTRVY